MCKIIEQEKNLGPMAKFDSGSRKLLKENWNVGSGQGRF